MEIKMKFNDVLELNNALKTIIDNDKLKINVLLKFRLLGIAQSIKSHITNFEIIKNEKIIEYGKETKGGVYKIPKDDHTAIDKFKKDIEQVLASEITLNIDMLKPGEVFNNGLISEYLIALYPIIRE